MSSMIKEYLKAMVKLSKTQGRTRIGNYFSLEDFVYQNGQSFKVQSFPKDLSPGKIKQCFKNASLLVIEQSEYLYAEGYAMIKTLSFPVLHAWCVDKDNNAIDPTWDNGKEYFGITFKRNYLFDIILSQEKACGLIDDWENNWPVLKLDNKIWKEVMDNDKKK